MTIADLHAIANDIDNTPGSGKPVRLERNHRRLRVFVDGVVIADTIRSLYLFEIDHLPVYYFPKEDVHFDLLEHTDHTSHCPRKGDAEYWSIVVGDRRIDNAVWSYPVPLDGTPDLSGYVAFYWDKVDNWFEEDEEVYVHARDPYKRIDALRSSRHVEIRLNGETIADTTNPILLFETGLPTRYYIPKLDVRLDLLRPSARDAAASASCSMSPSASTPTACSTSGASSSVSEPGPQPTSRSRPDPSSPMMCTMPCSASPIECSRMPNSSQLRRSVSTWVREIGSAIGLSMSIVGTLWSSVAMVRSACEPAAR